MKDKNTMKKFFAFQLNECDAFKEYLEEMALKGWKLKDINTFLYFEKIEPQKLIYSVEVFDKASSYDTRPEEKTREYIDYCAEAGWEYVCCFGKVNVFVTANENIVPIETDDELKFNAVKRGMIKQNFIQWFVLPLLFLFNNLLPLLNFKTYITSNLSMLNILMLIVFYIIVLGQLISYIVWCKNMRKRLLNSEPLKYLNRKDLKRRNRLRLAPLAICFILLIWITITSFLNADYNSALMVLVITALVIIIWGSAYLIKKIALSREANIALIMVSGFGASLLMFAAIFIIVFAVKNPISIAPLSIDDFGLHTEQTIDSDIDFSSSIFAKKTSCNYTTEDYSFYIDYSIIESDYPYIIRKCAESDLRQRYSDFKKVNIPAWGAESVYISPHVSSDVIAVYKNYLFTCDSNTPLKNDAIKAIVKKLDLR